MKKLKKKIIEQYKRIVTRIIIFSVITLFIIFPLITLFGISYAAVKFTNNTSEGRCGMRFISNKWDPEKVNEFSGYYGEKCSFDFGLMKSEIYQEMSPKRINYTSMLGLNQYAKFFKNKFNDQYKLNIKNFKINTTVDDLTLNGMIMQLDFAPDNGLSDINVRPLTPNIAEDKNMSIINSETNELIEYNIENHKKTIIIHHGFQSNMWAMGYQIYPLLRSGYTVIIYNARNHGDSAEAQVTLSFNEGFDLRDIINYSLGRKTDIDNNNIDSQYLNSEYGLYGFSMGGATVLRFATQLNDDEKIKEKLKFVIMESGFIDLEVLLKAMIINVSRLPEWLVYPGAKMWWRNLKKIPIEQIRPHIGINEIPKIPLYITYGGKDNVIPLEMSSALYTQKIVSEEKQENKIISKIMQVKFANHGSVPYLGDLSNNNDVISQIPTYNWRNAILNFIKKYM